MGDDLWFYDLCENAIQAIKAAFVSAPILSLDFFLPFTVQIDTSSFGIDVVLSQKDFVGLEQVVRYTNNSHLRRVRNYSTAEKECLAVLFVVTNFRPYLEGFEFVVISNHHSII